MSDRSKDSQGEDRMDARLVEVWTAAAPPPGFVERALARLDAEPQRRRWRPWAIGLGAAAAAAVIFVVASRSPRAQGEERPVERLSLPLTTGAVAVMEPRAHLRWEAKGGAVTVSQDAGEVFYRVDRGVAFVVHTPSASIEVAGTCFKVEVSEMSPVTHSLVAGAVGAVLSAAVVSVYEGKVRVRNQAGEVTLAPGQRASVSGAGAPPVIGGPGARAPIPRLSAHTLNALGADARATVAALEERVASLTSELAEAKRLAVEGPRDGDGIPKNKYHDFTPEELATLARRCEIRYDVPVYLMGAPPELPPNVASRMGIAEPDRVRINQGLQEFAPAHVERIRALYAEATNDPAAAQKLSPRDIQHALFERFPAELNKAKQRLAQERAGQIPVPSDANTGPAVERMLRLIMTSSDELERRLGSVLGADRAHEIRRNDGFGGRRIQSGCPGEQSAPK
jgi:hypothetical protein